MITELSFWPLSQKVANLIIQKKPLHRSFMTASLKALTNEEKASAEEYIEFLLTSGSTEEGLCDAYLMVIRDMYKEELYFRRTGRYRCASYSEALEAVYNNDVYMRQYMIGLGLSSYWWINHALMVRFFKKTLRTCVGRIYREIGPGHGLYFLAAMRGSALHTFQGIDISATSVELTNRVVRSAFSRDIKDYRIWQGDFLTESFDTPANVLVMGEVLEHVENPMLFLRRAYEVTTEDAVVFFDHIFNPGSVESLEALIEEAGFHIAGRLVLPKQGSTIEQCVRENLSINVALVLNKSTVCSVGYSDELA